MAKNTHVIRGKVFWAKVLGDPVDNYNKDGKEWVVDLSPNEEGIELLEELGLEDRLKNKKDERGRFMAFRQREKRRDGSYNRRISVVDAQGNPWPADRLIGNETVVDLKFEVKDYGKGKHAGVYPQAIRVLEHVEYAPQHFAPLPEDDPYAANEFKNPEEGRLPEGMEPELGDDDFPE